MRYQELNESYHDQRIRDALNWQNPEDFDWIAEDASEELGIEIFDISEDEFNKFIESEWYQDKLFQAASNSYQKITESQECESSIIMAIIIVGNVDVRKANK